MHSVSCDPGTEEDGLLPSKEPYSVQAEMGHCRRGTVRSKYAVQFLILLGTSYFQHMAKYLGNGKIHS